MTHTYEKIKDPKPKGRRPLPEDKLTKSGKYMRKKMAEDPEYRERTRKQKQQYYIKNEDRLSKQKKGTRKKRISEVMKILGGKCESCGEPYDPNSKPKNLDFHHWNYDGKDLAKLERFGSIGETFRDIIGMAKEGKNPRKKFALLCQQCHNIETFVRQNQKKTWDCLGWLVDKGILDVETPDSTDSRKITDFLKS